MAHEHQSLNGSAAQPPAATTEPFLAVLFTIAGQRYGISVAWVCEIVSIASMVPIGGAPPYVRGLLNVRGRFLPVLDGRVLLNAAAPLELSNQIIIFGCAAPEFGLLVDQADSVRQATIVPGPAIAHLAGLPVLDHMLGDGARGAFHIDSAGLRSLLARTPLEAPLP